MSESARTIRLNALATLVGALLALVAYLVAT